MPKINDKAKALKEFDDICMVTLIDMELNGKIKIQFPLK